MEFAVATVNVLTREKYVVIINIEECNKKITKEPQIEVLFEENTTGVFLTKRKNEDKDSDSII